MTRIITRLSRTRRIASTLLSVWYAYMLEYRAEIFLWAMVGLLPLILMGLWMQAAASGATAFSPGDFARYFFAVFLARQFTAVWVIYDFEYDVVDGRLSPYLLQPIDPVWRYMAGHAAERLTRLPLLVGFSLAFFWLFPEARWLPAVGDVLLCALALALAFLLRFAIQYSVAMLAFWIERVSEIEKFWFLLFFFFSGTIAPLDLYPPAVRDAAMYTPFPYFAYFPAQLLTGRPAPIALGFVVMLGWLAFFFVVNRVLWRRGLKQHSGMGA
ncbi:MAG: ABC-2 family transporter protein [Planctomycetota bacterium]|nr:ABC-2 family transporter protein [Planctomycetota bacterium]